MVACVLTPCKAKPVKERRESATVLRMQRLLPRAKDCDTPILLSNIPSSSLRSSTSHLRRPLLPLFPQLHHLLRILLHEALAQAA